MDVAVKMITEEQQEAARQAYFGEKGTEPPCPFCQKPRVKRSDYIRCLPCGVNWLQGENIFADPRIERHAQLIRELRSGNSRMGDGTAETSTTSESTRVWRDQQANAIRRKLGMPIPGERDLPVERTKKAPATAAPLTEAGVKAG